MELTSSPRTRVGKYELGNTLGEGTFAKVKIAKNKETGESVAIKVIDKEKILKHKMVDQIKREISTRIRASFAALLLRSIVVSRSLETVLSPGYHVGRRSCLHLCGSDLIR
jgi:serine/threonine protein kinase